jgi:murein DD-endopeptidase MepM/ murein hydrolase activator NlpD
VTTAAPIVDVDYPGDLQVFPVIDAGLPAEPNPRRPERRCAARVWWDDWHDAVRGGGALHRGQDIFAPRGSPIVAPVDLVVLGVGVGAKSGNYVSAREMRDGSVRWFFAHLNETPTFERGKRIPAGGSLGTVGSSGNAHNKCPHLHLEARKGEMHYRLASALRRAQEGPTGAPKGAA